MQSKWFMASGLVLNPAANQVLIDTDGEQLDLSDLKIVAYASVGVVLILQEYMGSTVISSQRIPVTMSLETMDLGRVKLQDGCGLRLISRDDVVGEVEASFFFD